VHEGTQGHRTHSVLVQRVCDPVSADCVCALPFGESGGIPPSRRRRDGTEGLCPHCVSEGEMGHRHTVSLYGKSVTSPYGKSVTSEARWYEDTVCPVCDCGISSSNNRLRLIDRLLEVIMPCFNHLGSVYITRVSRFRISGCLSGYRSTKPHRRVSGDSQWHSACLPIRLGDKLSKLPSALWRDSRWQITRFVE